MELEISTLAQRPDAVGKLWEMPSPWPEIMRHDPIGNLFYGQVTDFFPEYVLLVSNGSGELIAQAFAAPFQMTEDELFDDGWDGVLRRALNTRLDGRTPNAVSAIEIAIRPDHQGKGLSGRVLAAMRENVSRLGFRELFAPVRPNGKQDPGQPMSEYAFQVRADGLPVDPWLRVHVRAGGRIDRIAPRSMVIPGTLAEWRDWTGLPFDTSGPVVVPHALAPVHCDVAQNQAVYVEPNVWVRHTLTT